MNKDTVCYAIETHTNCANWKYSLKKRKRSKRPPYSRASKRIRGSWELWSRNSENASSLLILHACVINVIQASTHVICGDVFCGKTVCRTRDPNQQPRHLGAERCAPFVSYASVPHLEGPIRLAIYNRGFNKHKDRLVCYETIPSYARKRLFQQDF